MRSDALFFAVTRTLPYTLIRPIGHTPHVTHCKVYRTAITYFTFRLRSACFDRYLLAPV